MNEVAIEAAHLSKFYRIGGRRPHDTLREDLADNVTALLTRNRWRGGRDRGIWALRDASFQVKRGEVIGIIGRNGAGKSTLLKILSRITEPTEGKAEIRGRLGSLLEVGAGFHGELTGRENIYLNGAILGMKRREIDRKFDQIVDFAEIGTFLDTPVKRYSSGMFVRLGFSVAAHLAPSVLLVDEVLAVGDARFWSKSIAKMRALNAQGMTIALVTHELFLIQTMCSRALCLEHGRIVADGEPLRVMAVYRDLNSRLDAPEEQDAQRESATIQQFQIVPQGGWSGAKSALPNSGMRVTIAARVTGLPRVRLRVRVTGAEQFAYFTVYSDFIETPPSGEIECEATIPHLMLLPGEYRVWGAVCSHDGETGAVAEANVPFLVDGTEDLVYDKSSLYWNQAHWDVRNRS